MKKEKAVKFESEKARVQFDFNIESLEKLDAIKEQVKAPTRAEVIRRALSLFTEFLDAQQNGAVITFQYPNGEKERLKILL